MSSNVRTIWDSTDDFPIDILTSAAHYEQYARLLHKGDEILVYSRMSNARAHLFVTNVKPKVEIERVDQPKTRPVGRPAKAAA